MRPALRSLVIITAALCVPLVPFFIIGEIPGDRWLSAQDDGAGAFALAGAGLLAADAVLPIPSSIVGTMLGARLGFMPGFAAAFLGLMTGQVIAYAASRYVLRHKRQALPTAPTLAVLFLSRPVPVLAEAVAFAAGAARVSWPQFLLACGVGNVVYAGALALNGAELIPVEPWGVGLVLPMLLPVTAWFAWRALRHRSTRGG
jgi:uncharacterized membrane protein YdjX (TVP38/TMEM64 family)